MFIYIHTLSDYLIIGWSFIYWFFSVGLKSKMVVIIENISIVRNCLPFQRTEVHPPVFSGVRVTRSLVLCLCFVDRCLSFYPFSFGHFGVCSSPNPIVVCPFILFLLAIVVSVLLRFTDSDYPFGIFKLFLIILFDH
jgi:hypothetical protein